MPCSNIEFFRAFLAALNTIDDQLGNTRSQLEAEFNAETADLDPYQANEYALEQFGALSVDQELLSLYRSVRDFQADYTGGEPLTDDVPMVVSVVEYARATGDQKPLSLARIPPMMLLLEQSLAAQIKTDFLIAFLRRNAQALQEYRIQQLEQSIRKEETDDETHTSLSDYTLTRQALALHFLLTEGMEVTNIDTTRVIALAHLLSGKKIPLKNGQENIGNSGIKTAFGKMWQKKGKHHLADLRFILRFFKPFENAASKEMQRTINAIEKEINKTEVRLNKNPE